MNDSNIYSRLLDVLAPTGPQQGGVVFGTLTGVDPLTVRIGGREVGENLFKPGQKVFHVEQIGQELALLPFESGLLILFEVEACT